jgi:hypothetical protein
MPSDERPNGACVRLRGMRACVRLRGMRALGGLARLVAAGLPNPPAVEMPPGGRRRQVSSVAPPGGYGYVLHTCSNGEPEAARGAPSHNDGMAVRLPSPAAGYTS